MLVVPPDKYGRPVLSAAWAMVPVAAACLALPETSAHAPPCTGLRAEYCRKSPVLIGEVVEAVVFGSNSNTITAAATFEASIIFCDDLG